MQPRTGRPPAGRTVSLVIEPEKQRTAESYDCRSSGIDYTQGTYHLLEGTHYIKCTDAEFAAWT